jgi:hypothetical protein
VLSIRDLREQTLKGTLTDPERMYAVGLAVV